jgi:hypothetical protein
VNARAFKVALALAETDPAAALDLLLTFGVGNAKVGGKVHTFSLPAGWTCPGAMDCLARANRETGKVTDGPDTAFRCFSVTMEARHTSVRNSRWRNRELLQSAGTSARMAELIQRSLPARATIVRIHVGGDFFSKAYLDAWIAVAEANPNVRFYAYTKSVSLFIGRVLPANLVITASVGGRQDHLIPLSGLRTATVVFSEAEAEALGLAIDHDDTHAMFPGPSFALLIHGTQPKGSRAAAALRAL